MEINYRFTDILSAGDELMKFKYIIRNVAWEGGSILLQKAGNGAYGVELQDLDGRLRTQVVRFGDPAAPVSDQQRQRDREIESQWCSAHARTLDSLRQEGFTAQVMAHREAGENPLLVRASSADLQDRESRFSDQPNQQRMS